MTINRVLSYTILLLVPYMGPTIKLAHSKSKSIKIALFDLNLVTSEQSMSASSKKGSATKAPKIKPPSTEELLEFANQVMRKGLRSRLSNQTRFRFIETHIRQQLLDPAWNQSPSTIEEALELGRELGTDWVIQGRFKEIGRQTYRITLYLLAVSPDIWTPPKLLPSNHASQFVDFNTLSAPSLVLAEHIVWASRREGIEVQLAKAGLRLLLKADQEQLKRKNKLLIPVETSDQKEEEEEEEKPPKLSAREKKAKELSDAARKELDDVQVRLDAEHKRRLEEVKLKQEALAEEASDAWRVLEELTNGAGLKTVKVEQAPKPVLSRRQKRRRKKRDQAREIIKPAMVSWSEVKEVTQYLTQINQEEHRELLLSFIRTYQKLTSYQKKQENSETEL